VPRGIWMVVGMGAPKGRVQSPTLFIVMAGLVPAIHDPDLCGRSSAWMPGTSPGMTI
jgi:hypothetical protein